MNKYLLIILLSCSINFNCYAKPYTPANDEVVLLKLSPSISDLARKYDTREVSSLDLEKRFDKVTALLQRAKLEKSERLYGEAEALLELPSNIINKHKGLLLLKADIQQHFHQFSAALDTLSEVKSSPQGRLLEANILLTQGEYDEARRACTRLIGHSSLLIVTTCVSQTTSMRGQLKQSYTLLERTLGRYPDESMQARHWALTSLAEMAERLGEVRLAISHYQHAISIQSHDIVSRIALSDLYMQTEESEHALIVLQGKYKNDAVLLRAIRSSPRMTDLHEVQQHQLNRRIELMEMRNDGLHLDTLAEYYLYNKKIPKQALFWANAHWETQKTPRDARLLLRAAINANDINAIKIIQAWQQKNKLEDYWIELKIKQYVVKPHAKVEI